MIKGIGTDIIEIDRIQDAITKNEKFLEKLFTEDEQEYFLERNNKIESIAGNFAAKEAISKALGTGISGFGLRDIEILRNDFGKPYVNVSSKVLERIESENIKVHVSISHCKTYATAMAVVEEE